MRRVLPVVIAAALVISGCSRAEPEVVDAAALAACAWRPHPATAKFFDDGFRCLDGEASAVPVGFPASSIVNVWGSWCAPCREEIPFFVRLAAEHDVTIIGVDVDEPSMIAGQRFALRQGMTWPNVLDTSGATAAIFGPGVPVTWFIDAQGQIVERKIGVIRDYAELFDLARKHGLIK